jgi:lysophospholipase L1-like esterase
VIISLGSNDHRYIKTQAELERLRDKITASRVYWVLPRGNSPKSGLTVDEVQRIIKVIAALHGDTVIPIARVQSDGIHPSWAGYKQIASSIKQ